MYLPDASAFAFALLIGAVAAANIALLNFVGRENASKQGVFDEFRAFWIVRPLARIKIQAWALAVTTVLVGALILHLANVFIDGSSASGPNGAISQVFEASVSPAQGSADLQDGASVPREQREIVALDSFPARSISVVVMALLLAGTGATLGMIFAVSQVHRVPPPPE